MVGGLRFHWSGCFFAMTVRGMSAVCRAICGVCGSDTFDARWRMNREHAHNALFSRYMLNVAPPAVSGPHTSYVAFLPADVFWAVLVGGRWMGGGGVF